jgi:hypothetical protein
MLAKYKVLEFCFLHKVAQLTYLIHEIITILFVQIFTHFETYNFVDILSNGNANVVLYIYFFSKFHDSLLFKNHKVHNLYVESRNPH